MWLGNRKDQKAGSVARQRAEVLFTGESCGESSLATRALLFWGPSYHEPNPRKKTFPTTDDDEWPEAWGKEGEREGTTDRGRHKTKAGRTRRTLRRLEENEEANVESSILPPQTKVRKRCLYLILSTR